MEYNPNRFRDVMQFSRTYFPPKGRRARAWFNFQLEVEPNDGKPVDNPKWYCHFSADYVASEDRVFDTDAECFKYMEDRMINFQTEIDKIWLDRAKHG
jgi:hypothetical protein